VRGRQREGDRQTETGRDKIPNFKFYGDIISKKKKERRRRTFMTLSINALSTNRIFVPELWLVALNLECTCVMNGIA